MSRHMDLAPERCRIQTADTVGKAAEKALEELVRVRRKDVEKIEWELAMLHSHAALLKESFSVPTFPPGHLNIQPLKVKEAPPVGGNTDPIHKVKRRRDGLKVQVGSYSDGKHMKNEKHHHGKESSSKVSPTSMNAIVWRDDICQIFPLQEMSKVRHDVQKGETVGSTIGKTQEIVVKVESPCIISDKVVRSGQVRLAGSPPLPLPLKNTIRDMVGGDTVPIMSDGLPSSADSGIDPESFVESGSGLFLPARLGISPAAPGPSDSDQSGRKSAKICKVDVSDHAGSSMLGPVKLEALDYVAPPNNGKSCSTSTCVCRKDLKYEIKTGTEEDRQKVQKAREKFEELRQEFIGAEGTREIEVHASGQKCHKRPDLRAIKWMGSNNLRVNKEKVVGNVPGIYVGDRFVYRAEVHAVGLHLQSEAGISYFTKTDSPLPGLSLAISIVMKKSASPYHDDAEIENGDLITYTGQGGLSQHNNTAVPINDQELTRGNEALRNSFKTCTPVRVIRGQKDASSLNGESYTYLGLYHIVEMRYEAGMQGMLVYKFVLRRLPGQPQLSS